MRIKFLTFSFQKRNSNSLVTIIKMVSFCIILRRNKSFNCFQENVKSKNISICGGGKKQKSKRITKISKRKEREQVSCDSKPAMEAHPCRLGARKPGLHRTRSSPLDRSWQKATCTRYGAGLARTGSTHWFSPPGKLTLAIDVFFSE